jgi:N-acetylglutamate synthase-like GNAT family acetyltransferase
MSLYEEYVRERGIERIIEIPDVAFITYVLRESLVYIADIYVTPAYRNSYVATDLQKQVADEAKKLGIKVMTATVAKQAFNADSIKKGLINFGFEITDEDSHTVWFSTKI